MTKLTTSQLAERIGLSIPQTKKLLREEVIKGCKIDPSKRNSPYLISEREADRYQKAPKLAGRKVIRCEPCNHQPKKLCASCRRSMCLKDYRYQAKTGLPSAKCKDCEYARIKANRRLANALI